MRTAIRNLTWLSLGALAACNGADDTDGTDDTDVGETDTVDTDDEGPVDPSAALKGRYEVEEVVQTAERIVPLTTKILDFDGVGGLSVLTESPLGFRGVGRFGVLVSGRQLLLDGEYASDIYTFEVSGSGKLTLVSPFGSVTARRKSGLDSPSEWVPHATTSGEYLVTTSNAADIAWDGTGIWYCDGYNPEASERRIRRFDWGSGTVNATLPGSSTIGVVWDGTQLWTSSNGYSTIQRIDMSTGTATFTSRELGPWIYGIAHDGDMFWAYSGNAGTLYRYSSDDDAIDLEVDLSEEQLDDSVRGMTWHDGALYLVRGQHVHRAEHVEAEDTIRVTDTWALPGRWLSGITHDGTQFYVMSVDARTNEVWLSKLALP